MPRQDCAACGSASRRGKLISCLHSLCVECLPKHSTDQGCVCCPLCSVTTPPPPRGVPLLQYLPDSEAYSGAADDASDLQRRLCDECAEDTVAVAVCTDCGDYFCATHAEGHPTSRRTYKHKVHLLTEVTGDAASRPLQADAAATSQHKCSFHPPCMLCSYCMTCEQLLCEQCLSVGKHTQHQVQSITDVSSAFQASFKAKLTSTFSSQPDSSLEELTAKVGKSLNGLRDETEAVSTQIDDYFFELRTRLDQRQQDLLDRLDRLQYAHVGPLQQKKEQLVAAASTGDKLKHLTESCSDPVNFLKMYKWLEQAVADAASAAQDQMQAFVPGTLAFSTSNREDVSKAIAQSGCVFDSGMVSAEHTTVAVPVSMENDTDLTIAIETRNARAEDLHVTDKHLATVQVNVSSVADNVTTACPVTKVTSSATASKQLSAGSSSSRSSGMLATYKTGDRKGEVRVCATVDGQHMKGSPAIVTVTDKQLRFDPSRCDVDLLLSNNGRTVTHTAGMGWKSVYGLKQWREGYHEIAVRLDSITRGKIHHKVFICSAAKPKLNNQKGATKELQFGWYSNHPDGGGPWKGIALGQPWKAGDVIRMSLDCDKHTLVGLHERTGATETITGVTGDLYLCISLCHNLDRFTIL
ncbi:tripartite motif-containing protein 2-like [Sycon ciliatum]|uniref:tripartite motif-containing protein 2-like n=1 Tax=Sycon ciliatum TaxID=27933 RepID=UPI0031F69882